MTAHHDMEVLAEKDHGEIVLDVTTETQAELTCGEGRGHEEGGLGQLWVVSDGTSWLNSHLHVQVGKTQDSSSRG